MAVQAPTRARPERPTRQAPAPTPAAPAGAEPGRARRSRSPLARDGLGLVCVVLGLLAAVAVLLPAEGRVLRPVHDAIGRLLGQASVLLPGGLLAAGSLTLARSLAPAWRPPWLRLAGAALLAGVLVPTLHLVGLPAGGSLARAQAQEGGGLLGHWLGSLLLDLVGGPGAAILLGGIGTFGALLLLDLSLAEVGGWLRAALAWAGPRTVRATRLGGQVARVAAAGMGRRARRLGTVRRLDLVRYLRVPGPRPRRAPRPGHPPGPGQRARRPGLRLPAPAVAPIPPEVPPPPAPLAPPPGAPAPPGRSTSAGGGPPPQEPALAPPPEADAAAPPPAARPASPASPPAHTWVAPPLDLFQVRPAEPVSAADLQSRAAVIEETLASFTVNAHVVEINQGPAITQFGIEPADGVAVSKILARQHDLALRLGASPIRLEAPVPGKQMVGLEVPNGSTATVTLRDVLESPEWEAQVGRLRLALGRDVTGAALVGDLGRMPHLLIAGATGAGKSVCINTIVGGLLHQFTPDALQLVLIDPKRVELVGFGDVPHLRLPVITEMDRVVGVLKWVVLEMERRYRLFSTHGVRNLEAYNRWAAEASHPDEPPLPFLVVVIDELADMMMTAADEVEKLLCRLAQLARATGIHLVVATQRPSVDVLTGLIKANFPTRLAFAVSSQTDSRVILDQAGAEKLLGQGDALYMPTDAMKPVRLQGAFVSDDEVRRLVEHWKAQGGPRYTPADLEEIEALGRGEDADDEDDVYDRAVELAETVGRLSVSLLQRRLGIGKPRAQRLLDRLIEEGVAEEPG